MGEFDRLFDSGGSGGPSKLEKALEGVPADVVLRVRDYVRTFDIDEDDELFAFATALGLTTTLMEDAPERWRSLFDEVLAELEGWAQENRKSFADLNEYAQSAQQLGVLLEELIAATNYATDSRKMLKREMLEGMGKNADLVRQLAKELGVRLRETTAALKGVQERGQRADLLSQVALGLAAVLLFGGGVVSLRLVGQNRAMQSQLEWQRERTQFLLEKANRAECAYGIKPADDPQCL